MTTYTLNLFSNLPEVIDARGDVVARGSSFRDGDDEERAAYVRTVLNDPRAAVVIDGCTFFAPEPARYAVLVLDPSHVHLDRKPVIIRSCGHQHRTVAAAQRCCEALTRRYPDGSMPAKWWGAAVRHSDGSPLTDAETDILYEVAR